ncbi:hypothetical protein CCMA1212_002208 [Trichoderma ghanense]|uniref:Uncharacterized protein n=1 Tax=Trichoderma ghanense TaxID=65468 RepID=A0ABY2HEJ7_9HYPO
MKYYPHEVHLASPPLPAHWQGLDTTSTWLRTTSAFFPFLSFFFGCLVQQMLQGLFVTPFIFYWSFPLFAGVALAYWHGQQCPDAATGQQGCLFFSGYTFLF